MYYYYLLSVFGSYNESCSFILKNSQIFFDAGQSFSVQENENIVIKLLIFVKIIQSRMNKEYLLYMILY